MRKFAVPKKSCEYNCEPSWTEFDFVCGLQEFPIAVQREISGRASSLEQFREWLERKGYAFFVWLALAYESGGTLL